MVIYNQPIYTYYDQPPIKTYKHQRTPPAINHHKTSTTIYYQTTKQTKRLTLAIPITLPPFSALLIRLHPRTWILLIGWFKWGFVFVDGDVFFAGGFYLFEHVALVGVLLRWMCCGGGVVMLGWKIWMKSFQFVSCDPCDSDHTASYSRYIRSTSSDVATMYISAI